MLLQLHLAAGIRTIRKSTLGCKTLRNIILTLFVSSTDFFEEAITIIYEELFTCKATLIGQFT